ncbi:MAG: type I pantothenate kinase [Myxococcota bacterium]|jgi:type I pantothenate kinase
MARSPHMIFDRTAWSQLRGEARLTLSGSELEELRGLNVAMSLEEVVEVYLPLARLISLHVAAAGGLHHAVGGFLGRNDVASPYVIGMAGSVAVGKSTAARVLRALLSRLPHAPRVELITTDGFLMPNAELSARGLMRRKGFPESYDRGALLRFVAALKSGEATVTCPRYSHLVYDVIPDDPIIVHRPDIVIIEGLNVLQPSPSPGQLWVSDFFDLTIYIDAVLPDLRRWYLERFRALRDTAFRDSASYFHRYTLLSDEVADEFARSIWTDVNEVNLIENILPTRERATLILKKAGSHRIEEIKLRRR